MRLRSEENELNDKGGRGGGGGYSLRWGEGTLPGMCSSNRVSQMLGFCDTAIDFRQFWSLIGNGLL